MLTNKKLIVPGIGFALIVALAAIAIVAASAGDGSGDNDGRESVSADDQGKIAGDGSGLAMCVEGVPDCNDMVVNPDGDGESPDDAVAGEPPITSIDDIDPDQCNLVHNIDACEKQAMAAAVADLARNTGVAAKMITVVSTELTEWPDACLGVAQPKVACAEVITTGFRITLTAGEIQYEYRTDATGATVSGGK